MKGTKLQAILASCLVLVSASTLLGQEAQDVRVVVPQDLEAEVNGVRLHYLDWGGDGPVMLFIPGLSHTAHTFDAVAPAFTDRYRVMSVTRRGHGLSEKISSAPALDVLVDDLADFIDLFATEPVILVGQSYAGLEMLKLTQGEPETVRALIFLDAVYDWPGWLKGGSSLPGFPTPESFESYEVLDEWAETVWQEVWNEAARAHFRSQTYVAADSRVTWQFSLSGPLWGQFEANYREWTGTEFEGLTVPVLSMRASQEGFLTANLRRRDAAPEVVDQALEWVRNTDEVLKDRGHSLLMASVPDAVVVTVENTYHSLHLQRPERVINSMTDFLEHHVSP